MRKIQVAEDELRLVDSLRAGVDLPTLRWVLAALLANSSLDRGMYDSSGRVIEWVTPMAAREALGVDTVGCKTPVDALVRALQQDVLTFGHMMALVNSGRNWPVPEWLAVRAALGPALQRLIVAKA